MQVYQLWKVARQGQIAAIGAAFVMAAGVTWAAMGAGINPALHHNFAGGTWQVRPLNDAGRPVSSLCAMDIDRLIRVEHPHGSCTQTIIEQGPSSIVVHYSCAANGWGRSDLRMDTPRVGRLMTQGIAKGVPFSYQAEVRRTADCP